MFVASARMNHGGRRKRRGKNFSLWKSDDNHKGTGFPCLLTSHSKIPLTPDFPSPYTHSAKKAVFQRIVITLLTSPYPSEGGVSSGPGQGVSAAEPVGFVGPRRNSPDSGSGCAGDRLYRNKILVSQAMAIQIPSRSTEKSPPRYAIPPRRDWPGPETRFSNESGRQSIYFKEERSWATRS